MARSSPSPPVTRSPRPARGVAARADAAVQENSGVETAPHAAVASWGVVVAGVGLLAAGWIASGSVGLMARPLRSVLVWLALGLAMLAAGPRRGSRAADWLWLLGAALAAAAWIAVGGPVAGVMGAVLVGAALVRLQPHAAGRNALLAATLGTALLGLFHSAETSLPAVWWLGEKAGAVLGSLAGWLSGQPLRVGSTFGGVNLLVSLLGLYAVWLLLCGRPHMRRAACAALVVALAHLAYLIVLAHAHQLQAALPDYVIPPESDNDRLGIWTWGNALHKALPWNLPALAALAHGLVAAGMLRLTRSVPAQAAALAGEAMAASAARGSNDALNLQDQPASRGATLAIAALAVLWALLVGLVPGKVDLKGKTIVAYERGYLNWVKPEHDAFYSQWSHLYGILPDFIASLGGELAHSEDLTAEDLARADVVLLIHPDQPWPEDRLERLLDYVRGGGSLLVVAEPRIFDGNSRSSFPELLSHTAIQVRDDTALPPADYWQDNLRAAPHPVTAGLDDSRGRFGMVLASSIELGFGAKPVLVGPYGLSDPGSDAALNGTYEFEGGERLGDLVLAAEQRLGRGRVFVLGDTAPLRCEGLAGAWQFVGRVLGYLAGNGWDPGALWRQLAGALSVLGLVALLFWRPQARNLAVLAVVLPLASGVCESATFWSWRVLPDGRTSEPNNLAFVDASHLEVYSDDAWNSFGLGNYLRTLARNGFLPLQLYDEPFGLDRLWGERLRRAGLLVSFAPAKRFSDHQRQAVRDMLAAGGTLISMCGAEQAGPTNDLLAEFGLHVDPSPLPPSPPTPEPEPMGSVLAPFLVQGEDIHYLQVYAAWPVEALGHRWESLATGRNGQPVVMCQPGPTEDGPGRVVLIGDTYLAVNENVQLGEGKAPANEAFWRWLFGRVTPREEWIPPPQTARTTGAAGAGQGGRSPAEPSGERPSGERPSAERSPGEPPPGEPELPEPGGELEPPDETPAEPTPPRDGPRSEKLPVPGESPVEAIPMPDEPPHFEPPADPFALPGESPGEARRSPGESPVEPPPVPDKPDKEVQP